MTLKYAAVAALALLAFSTCPASEKSHGLWVWKGPDILKSAADAKVLVEFCRSHDVNEVYLAVSSHGVMMADERLASVVGTLHGGGLRVEALLSSDNADEAGPHRDKLLSQVQNVVQFNRRTAGAGFDGIHLDIEPQQRTENKGSGNLRFLPGLVETYRAVRGLAEPLGLSVNADIQNKLLKGSIDERRLLLGALPRVTLMMYELRRPGDGQEEAAQADQVRLASQKFLDMAYQGLEGPSWAGMIIALRVPDYGSELPVMLQTLAAANASNPHFLGWAEHSYNEQLE